MEKATGLTFYEAFEAMKQGRVITDSPESVRIDKKEMFFLHADEILTWVNNGWEPLSGFKSWQISSTNWSVVPEKTQPKKPEGEGKTYYTTSPV